MFIFGRVSRKKNHSFNGKYSVDKKDAGMIRQIMAKCTGSNESRTSELMPKPRQYLRFFIKNILNKKYESAPMKI